MAASDASKESYDTKAKCRDIPVASSRATWDDVSILSKASWPTYLWDAYDCSKRTECLVEKPFIDIRIQIPDEKIGADVYLLTVRARLVDADRLAVQFDTVHDLTGIFRVVLCLELGKPIPLV